MDKAWLEEQYITNGLSLREIAKKTPVSHETVRKWLIEYDIPVNNAGWQLKSSTGKDALKLELYDAGIHAVTWKKIQWIEKQMKLPYHVSTGFIAKSVSAYKIKLYLHDEISYRELQEALQESFFFSLGIEERKLEDAEEIIDFLIGKVIFSLSDMLYSAKERAVAIIRKDLLMCKVYTLKTNIRNKWINALWPLDIKERVQGVKLEIFRARSYINDTTRRQKIVPHEPGIYFLWGELGLEYIGHSKNVNQRLVGHNYYKRGHHIIGVAFVSDFNQRVSVEKQLIKTYRPIKNIAHKNAS
jgi:hypothetical protein